MIKGKVTAKICKYLERYLEKYVVQISSGNIFRKKLQENLQQNLEEISGMSAGGPAGAHHRPQQVVDRSLAEQVDDMARAPLADAVHAVLRLQQQRRRPKHLGAVKAGGMGREGLHEKM
jgi:hypothetical protein